MLESLRFSSYPVWQKHNQKIWGRNIPASLDESTRHSSLYPETVVASSDALGWQNVQAIHLRHNLNELVLPPSDSHCVVLNLGTPLQLHAHLADRRFEGRIRNAEIAIVPAGSSWTCHSQNSGSWSALLLYLRPLFVRSAVSELHFSYKEIGITPDIGFRNKHILHVAMSLMCALNDANVLGRFYADSLANGLAMQLVRRFTSLKDVNAGRGGMAPHKLRKAIDLINRHFAEEQEGRVALRAVATAVGMSYFHFSRAFKQSMGMSPTNYIAERRIARAKELLKETELPISEIALRAGFSSQSHFTTSFRRISGSTPRAFRATI